jgi:GntR family transcriptional repressor for pyruvate dehydrogenase complex
LSRKKFDILIIRCSYRVTIYLLDTIFSKYYKNLVSNNSIETHLYRERVIEMKSNATRIERKRLTDQIIDQLISMIVDKKLTPGDKLPPEPMLMEQFGVGRSSVREAIGALSLIGLLTVRPGHGTQVSVSSEEFLVKPLRWGMMMMGGEKVHELVEARIVIEQAMVGMAAKRATDDDVAEIKLYQHQLKAAKKPGRKAIQADLSFHNALGKASHNSVLRRFLAELRQPLRSWMEQKASFIGGYDMVIEQHDAILNAIEAHDVERARSALREHLESVGERLTAILLERQAKEIDKPRKQNEMLSSQ